MTLSNWRCVQINKDAFVRKKPYVCIFTKVALTVKSIFRISRSILNRDFQKLPPLITSTKNISSWVNSHAFLLTALTSPFFCRNLRYFYWSQPCWQCRCRLKEEALVLWTTSTFTDWGVGTHAFFTYHVVQIAILGTLRCKATADFQMAVVATRVHF